MSPKSKQVTVILTAWGCAVVGIAATAVNNRPPATEAGRATGSNLERILGSPVAATHPGIAAGWTGNYTLALIFVSLAVVLGLVFVCIRK